MIRDDIRDLIYSALYEISRSRSADRSFDVTEDTVLLGAEGSLESVEIVNLIVSTEIQLEEQHGVLIALADDEELWEGMHALRTVGSFTDYVYNRLQREQPV